MEVDFVDGAAVGAGFGGGQLPEHRHRAIADRAGEGTGPDDVGDDGEIAVVALFADLKVHVGGGDRPTGDLLDAHRVVVERELAQFGLEVPGRPAGVHQRAEEHVAGGAGEGIEEGDFHAPSRAPRQIWAAR